MNTKKHTIPNTAKAIGVMFVLILKKKIRLKQHHTSPITIILLPKTTAVQNKVALSYQRVRGLYFLAVVFVATIDTR